jgi:hypothetical protein
MERWENGQKTLERKVNESHGDSMQTNTTLQPEEHNQGLAVTFSAVCE